MRNKENIKIFILYYTRASDYSQILEVGILTYFFAFKNIFEFLSGLPRIPATL